MKITPHIHALKIDFGIDLPNGAKIRRHTWVYLILGKKITLIDTGVAGSWTKIKEYIESIGRDSSEIETCILSHSHPDHIGGAQTVKSATGCQLLAHPASALWIEQPDEQFRVRPVPSFHTLVEGAVTIDAFLCDGQLISPEGAEPFRILHTPGHEKGHMAFHFEQSNVLISIDACMPKGDMPTYDDFRATVKSMNRLIALPKVETMLCSFTSPVLGRDSVVLEMAKRLDWLHQIHATVVQHTKAASEERLKLCIQQLGFPQTYSNPVVKLAFDSHGEPETNVYFLAEIKEITDPQAYAEYVSRVNATVARYDGIYRGYDKAECLEGNHTAEKTILIEFPSHKALLQWWQSPEYRDIVELRHKSTQGYAISIQIPPNH